MAWLGFGGMALGLLFDLSHAGPQRLADLGMQAAPLGLADSLQLHLQFLPGMHAGMALGMAGGTVLNVALYRVFLVLRPHARLQTG